MAWRSAEGSCCWRDLPTVERGHWSVLGKTLGEVFGSRGDERAGGTIPIPKRATANVCDHMMTFRFKVVKQFLSQA
jgi:hypothetical protein